MDTLGYRLKVLREKRDLTLEQVATAVGTTKVSIGRYEKDEREPKGEMLTLLANFYNVTSDYLLGLSCTPNPKPTKKEREVTKIIDNMREELKSAEGLMFNGNPASPEAIESILDAMRIGIEIANERNKKYIPKKYRKDKE